MSSEGSLRVPRKSTDGEGSSGGGQKPGRRKLSESRGVNLPDIKIVQPVCVSGSKFPPLHIGLPAEAAGAVI